jgi:hypothetical protein
MLWSNLIQEESTMKKGQEAWRKSWNDDAVILAAKREDALIRVGYDSAGPAIDPREVLRQDLRDAILYVENHFHPHEFAS